MACFVAVSGGFGNQLFCYALGRHLELSHGCEVLYDISFFQKPSSTGHNRLWLDRLGLPIKTTIVDKGLYNRLRKTAFLPLAAQRLLLGTAYLKYKPALRTPVPVQPDGVFYTGCWHDKAFFETTAATICEELNAAIGAQAPPQTSGEAKTVAMHVRRGDYLAHDPAAKLDYAVLLARARVVLRELLGGAAVRFLVFSDDLPWCEQHLVGEDIAYSPCRTMLDDFKMMLGCSHYLIANSTFSWWAAFLSTAPGKKVLVPRRWHANHTAREAGLVDAGWIEIDDQ